MYYLYPRLLTRHNQRTMRQVSKCRKGYATDHEARPLLRGALLRWLWRTRFCFVFGTVYLLVAGLALFREAPTTGPLADVNPMYFLFLRGIVTFSTLYNIWCVWMHVMCLPSSQGIKLSLLLWSSRTQVSIRINKRLPNNLQGWRSHAQLGHLGSLWSNATSRIHILATWWTEHIPYYDYYFHIVELQLLLEHRHGSLVIGSHVWCNLHRVAHVQSKNGEGFAERYSIRGQGHSGVDGDAVLLLSGMAGRSRADWHKCRRHALLHHHLVSTPLQSSQPEKSLGPQFLKAPVTNTCHHPYPSPTPTIALLCLDCMCPSPFRMSTHHTHPGLCTCRVSWPSPPSRSTNRQRSRRTMALRWRLLARCWVWSVFGASTRCFTWASCRVMRRAPLWICTSSPCTNMQCICEGRTRIWAQLLRQ